MPHGEQRLPGRVVCWAQDTGQACGFSFGPVPSSWDLRHVISSLLLSANVRMQLSCLDGRLQMWNSILFSLRALIYIMKGGKRTH